MADKLTCSLAIEGELTDKGLAAMSDSSDTMAKELTRMLVERSEDNRRLKYLWAAYRKKDVQMDCQIVAPGPVHIETVDSDMDKAADVKTLSIEAEQIGDKVVTVEFIEYLGRRKKKVTRFEVKQADLDKLIAESETRVQAQYAMF